MNPSAPKVSPKAFLGAVLAGILIVAYPFFVYWGLSRFLDVRLIAGILLSGFLVRALLARGLGGLRQLLPLFVGVSVICLLAVFTRDARFLLYYPVLVNGVMLVTFVHTLFRPPPMIERFARIQEPDLPEAGVRYCARVTQIWCGFFVINGSISAFTVLHADLKLWTLYNGFLGYVFMGLLFGIEYMVRQVVRRRESME